MEIVEHYTCLEWTTVGAQLILELRGSVDCHAQNPALLAAAARGVRRLAARAAAIHRQGGDHGNANHHHCSVGGSGNKKNPRFLDTFVRNSD